MSHVGNVEAGYSLRSCSDVSPLFVILPSVHKASENTLFFVCLALPNKTLQRVSQSEYSIHSKHTHANINMNALSYHTHMAWYLLRARFDSCLPSTPGRKSTIVREIERKTKIVAAHNSAPI